jgi:hypothetical protein
MGFLDNSGDIILDAVLTDEGRRRLALGDGSFTISKFALGDDEIDYGLYTPVTSSGYQDLRILKLPVFEAFTNNTSTLKHKLLSYADDELFYLPVVRINNIYNETLKVGGDAGVTEASVPIGGYLVTADTNTTTQISQDVSLGRRFASADQTTLNSCMIFDQGLDSGVLAANYLGATQPELGETRYIVEVDNRLLRLATPVGGTNNNLATPSFVDDDNVASYYFSMQSDPAYFAQQAAAAGPLSHPNGNTFVYDLVPNGNLLETRLSKIGPTDQTGVIGTRLAFCLRSSQETEASTSLFTTLGGSVTIATVNYYYIDTVVRVTGFNTGFRIDVPIKLLKKQ